MPSAFRSPVGMKSMGLGGNVCITTVKGYCSGHFGVTPIFQKKKMKKPNLPKEEKVK